MIGRSAATGLTAGFIGMGRRRIVDEGIGYGLALEGISAADVARMNAPQA